MKILYDYEIFYLQKYGGISNYFYQLSKEIINMNKDLLVVCPLHRNGHITKLPDSNFYGMNVNFIPHHFNKTLELINFYISKNIKKKFDPDIIHRTYYSDKECHGRKICTVYDLINEKYNSYFEKSEKISELKKKTIESSDHIICISENTKKDLIDIFKVPEQKISVTLLSSSFNNVYTDKKDKKFKNHLLFVGSRHGYKNFEGFLRAVSISKFLKNNFKIIVYGGERFSKKDHDLIKKYNLNLNQILFFNDDNYELSYLYSNVEALVYPSLYEGFGIPILEAMNFGCPVISSSAGSLKEVGGDGINYFDPSDPENISEVLEKIMSSKDIINKLISYGYERTKLFSWTTCAKKTLEIYKKVI
jgi:glycosyltransferase involved in cell wall biosynthesis